ncbi:hypothetical protein DFH07DRAFT_733332 [Mycena maculata]|uniref:MYND-type domain-containing protein n=1 Tax=Mycena maculata TaxID=230809 RepID=A0AAD7NT94_9AGAR|nr:hypothetical protein DFH07DRAFT_733332 [Mycena maculata]
MPVSSNTISFNGREYKLSEFLPEVITLADELAKNAQLKADSPLPADTDFSESEQREVQRQIRAILILPPEAISIFWGAFAAHHLTDVALSLRRLSHATQRHAVSTAIQILSLLPDPKEQPYFRKFLRNAAAAKGIPTIVARAFVDGTSWKRPSGPGHHCALIIHMLFWCDPSLGDDGKASVDADVRATLVPALESVLESTRGSDIEQLQIVEMERLKGILGAIDAMPGAHYLDSTRGYLEGQLDICDGNMCDEDAELSCSKCKTTRYCGKECQSWHWKHGHKVRCFKTDY